MLQTVYHASETHKDMRMNSLFSKTKLSVKKKAWGKGRGEGKMVGIK